MFDTAWAGWSTLTILVAGLGGGGPMLWIRASGQGQLMSFVSGLAPSERGQGIKYQVSSII